MNVNKLWILLYIRKILEKEEEERKIISKKIIASMKRKL